MKYTIFSQMILCAINIKNTVHCTDVNPNYKYQFHTKEQKI